MTYLRSRSLHSWFLDRRGQRYESSALAELLGVPAAKVNDDRLYRTLDRLLPHKPALEKHLKQRLGELFDLDNDLLLYDVTSTYFEGLAAANPQAQRGYSPNIRASRCLSTHGSRRRPSRSYGSLLLLPRNSAMSVDDHGLLAVIFNLRVFSDLIAEVASRQAEPSCGFRLHST